jgi:hypothetical protein
LIQLMFWYFQGQNEHTWGLTKCWWGAESFVAR